MATSDSSRNPRNSVYHKYNPFSRVYFCWLDPLILKGFRRGLVQNDLYVCPPEAESKHLLHQFNRHWAIEQERSRGPRLWIAIAKCLLWRLIGHDILTYINMTSLTCQSLLVGYLASYFTITNPSYEETRNAYLFATGLSLISFFLVAVNAMDGITGYKMSMHVRVITSSAIYQKILKLSQSVVRQLTVGHIINLASNDVHRFDRVLVCLHYSWTCLYYLSLITYFVYSEIGAVAFLATFLMLLQIPIQYLLGQIYIKLRLKAAKYTDKRIVVMNEVISGIRVIKMYGWEYAFHGLVAKIRKKEIQITLLSSIIRSINLSYYAISLPTILFVVFSVYVNIDESNTLSAKKLFTTFSFLASVRLLLSFLVTGIIYLHEAKAGAKRIKNLLTLNEHEIVHKDSNELNNSMKTDEVEKFKEMETGITVTDMSATWSTNESSGQTLSNITFKVDESKPLLAVVGPVGSGKSTILQCLLKELPLTSGHMSINGSIAYAAQEPWIYSDTLRENILFGEPYQCDWYNTVIDACALGKDIETLPEGDMTLVGERGVTLSGGQKARVSLARAVYSKSDIYLLDDPLSAVDSSVSRHLFEKCIRGVLSKSCVVLVTHQVQYLQQCDQVLALARGHVSFYGEPGEMLKNSEVLTGDGNSISSNLMASNDGGNIIKEELSSDEQNLEYDITSTTIHQDASDIETSRLPPEEQNEGTISYKTYFKYFTAGGGYIFTSFVLIIFVITEVSIVMTDWWISDWTECDENGVNSTQATCNLTNNQRIGLYALFVGSVWVTSLLRSFLFYILALRSARVLHDRMFTSVLRSPMLFFDTNPIGRILNRFSKDVGFIDDILIFTLCEFFQFVFRFFGIMVTAVIANPYVVIVVIILCVVFVFFRWYFVKPARDIKRIEALSRSPLYSHISMTLQGLSTIRAYGKEDMVINQFHDYHNKQTQAWYLYIISSRWFGLRVDTINCIFIACIAFTAIPLADSVNSSLIGLSLTYALTLNVMFQYCIRQSTEVESLMVSAERVVNYGKLESEASLETPSSAQKPPHWPSSGHIELNNLSYRYSNEKPMVLKDISCTINPGERVGIVGRTGAGKSSLIAAFFRLAEPSGSITIDGIDCFRLGLHDLRSNISIIPQDPVLFTGTIRYNLDPFGSYNDADIWGVIGQVQLKYAVDKLDGGLDAFVSEGGDNFSVGQRQLFCLARALLKNNKILMLDEATANVDLETDAIIQRVIRSQFSHCTVLTIAHRLDTVMDSDKIMVLSFGELCEFGEPYKLICQSDSYLRYLVDKTGPQTALKLKEMALRAYNDATSTDERHLT